jgi:hypothetical protein
MAVVAVLSAASIVAVVGLMLALDFYADKANEFSSLTYDQRQFGEWHAVPAAIRDHRVVEAARTTMPREARFRVVVGPAWTPAWRSNVSESVETDFLRFYLLPRKLTESEDAAWVFCLACDMRALGPRARVVAEGADGLRFVEVDE